MTNVNNSAVKHQINSCIFLLKVMEIKKIRCIAYFDGFDNLSNFLNDPECSPKSADAYYYSRNYKKITESSEMQVPIRTAPLSYPGLTFHPHEIYNISIGGKVSSHKFRVLTAPQVKRFYPNLIKTFAQNNTPYTHSIKIV